MANRYVGNPWKVAGHATIGSDIPAQFLNCRIAISHIEFEGYSIAGDVATILDRHNGIVWSAVGGPDLDNIVSQEIGWVNGISSIDAGGGVVLIYLRP